MSEIGAVAGGVLPPSIATQTFLAPDEKPRRVPLGESRRGTAIVRIAAILVVLGLWSAAPKAILPVYAFGKPWGVASQFWYVLHTAQIFPALLATFEGVAEGMVLAFPLGVILGLLCASRVLRWILVPFVTIGNAVPKIGLISLFIILLGVNVKTHIALVVSITTFVFYYSTRQALDEVDPNKMIAMRLMGAGRMKIVRSLILRSAAPQLFSAARIALPLGFTAEIFSELRVPTSKGLGVLLQNFQNALNGNGSIAIMIVVMAIGYFIDVVLGGRLRNYTDKIGAGVK